MKKLLNYLDGAGLCALIVAMCSQVDVRRLGRDTLEEGLGFATKTLKLAASDAVFLLVTLYFVGRVIQMRAWKRLWWPPLPCFALVFAMVLSMLHSPPLVEAVRSSVARESGLKNKITAVLVTKKEVVKNGKTKIESEPLLQTKEALAEIVQWSAYFLVAPWVLVNLLHDRRDAVFVSRRTLALGAFTLATVASGLVALVQLQAFKEDAPRGLFGSAHIYSAFLALALPLLLEQESKEGLVQRILTIASLSLIFITLATIVSPYALAAAGFGLFCTALARRGSVKLRAFRLVMVLALGILSVGLWRLPQSLQGPRDAETSLASKGQKVKKQFVEWQAALGWSVPRERTFATGVGPGNYQLNIGPYYSSLPNEEKMPPDSNNLWLVQGVSIGVLGLSALLWVVGHFWATAWRAAKTHPTDWLGAGVVGALGSWIAVNAFHALIVRGAGLILAFLFALAVVALQGERNDGAAPSVENTP